ncbi:MAG: hypothetical protein AAF490_01750 [Chloroflexota bacterium]
MNAVLADWKTADVSLKIYAALRLLERLTLDPMSINQAFIDELRQAGLDDHGMREVGNVSFHFNFMNRLADSFDFETLNERAQAVETKMLNRSGRFQKGAQADPVWIVDEDGHIRPTELARARVPLLTTPGKTTSELRQAAEAFTAVQRGQSRPKHDSLPKGLERYLKKVALYAYKIVDRQVEALKKEGYTDEMIYEITIAGAYGAALVGVERLFEVLYGEK